MNKIIRFEIFFENKKLIFDSATHGLKVGEIMYQSGDDGILVYDQTVGLQSNEVICQLSSNTSTLIPALKILGIPYDSYFDRREVIESQNNISFYWDRSRLAAFYNRYSTDGIDIEKRESIVRSAIDFLTNQKNMNKNFLPQEKLERLSHQCKLLGFYEGFPIFDAEFGMPQLLSRLGIHIGNDSILVSTPIDKYQNDVYLLSKKIEDKTRIKGFRKKNRVRFEKTPKILIELGI